MKMIEFKKQIVFISFGFLVFFGHTFFANAQYINQNNTSSFSVQSTEVVLNSNINPNGFATTAWFEYGTDSKLRDKTETPHLYIGSDNKEIKFSQNVIGLKPDTVYYFRIIANNGKKDIKGQILSFMTVTNQYNQNQTNIQNTSYVNTNQATYQNNNTNSVSFLTADSVKLTASLINTTPGFAQGYFEWGNTTQLGNITEYVNLDNTNTFSTTISNLAPNTTYYYRAIVMKDGKNYTGKKESFQTGNFAYQNNIVNEISYSQPVVNPNNIYTNNNYESNKNTATVINSGFLPNTIFGWILVILILVALMITTRKIFFK